MSHPKARRISALSDALVTHRVLHIKTAAQMLGVSEMTVRRDVGAHGDRFAFLGGHIVPAGDLERDGPYDLARAGDSHATAKRRACAHAIGFIKPDDTVFFDCGTTVPHLVDLLPEEISITAVCYALNVAERLVRKRNVRLVMLGGVYHPASASFSGPEALRTLNGLAINVAVLSAAGIDRQRGATCAHFHEAEIKRAAMARSRQTVLLVDSSKIGRLRPAFFGEAQAFDAVITEDGAAELPA
ncbi:DeoR family transcriptional regulator [Hoeflea marina]|uniref:DeoR family transcriptional regulator n=1 Tax=Hoeflea marina TaxID=274592 RepID=A0A317PKY0_9HYPH|nr:DeoR/GlpR family DNA-binding transcription regulator [Hoeflea marina]PWW01446.1 DeoR family transcriptional regulator [Hoeflea marina]